MKKQINTAAFTPFVNKVNDAAELPQLLADLNNIARFLFKGKEGTIFDKAKDFMPSYLAPIFLELEKAGLEPQGDRDQQKFINELILYLGKLPKVKITLAFEPTRDLVDNLNGLITQEADKKVILEIVVNQFIVGGAIFEYRGKVYKDTLEDKLNGSLFGLIRNMAFSKPEAPKPQPQVE